MKDNYKICVFCGSRKKTTPYMKKSILEYDKNGYIVLYPTGLFDNEFDVTEYAEDELMEKHFKRIDLSDLVIILTVNDYIEEGTRKELTYARDNNKRILFIDYKVEDDKILRYREIEEGIGIRRDEIYE